MGTKHGGKAWAGQGGGGLGTLGRTGTFPVTDVSRDDAAASATIRIDAVMDAKISALAPPRGQMERLSALKRDVQRVLSREMSIVRINVIGSAAKGTQIRRVRGNDIDLQTELNPVVYRDWRDNPSGPLAALTKIKSVLDKEPRYNTAEIHVDRNVVSVKIGSETVDIAPTFAGANSGEASRRYVDFPYLGEELPTSPARIPDTAGTPRWIETDGGLSVRYLKRMDREFNGEIVFINQVAKKVNEDYGGVLPSHLLECLVLEHFHRKPTTGENSHRANVREFFRDLPWLLRDGVNDPISHARADRELTPRARSQAIRMAQTVAEDIDSAEQAARSGRIDEAAERYAGLVDG